MIYHHTVIAVFEYFVNKNVSITATDDYQFIYKESSDDNGELVSLTYFVTERNECVSEITFCKNGCISGFKQVGPSVNDEEGKDYLYGKDLLKYVDALVKEKQFEDKSAFDEAITVREMSTIPVDSNPYHYDSIRMGCSIGHNWEAMYYSPQSSERDLKPSLTELILINTKTGRRFHLDLTKANELPELKEIKEQYV